MPVERPDDSGTAAFHGRGSARPEAAAFRPRATAASVLRARRFDGRGESCANRRFSFRGSPVAGARFAGESVGPRRRLLPASLQTGERAVREFGRAARFAGTGSVFGLRKQWL